MELLLDLPTLLSKVRKAERAGRLATVEAEANAIAKLLNDAHRAKPVDPLAYSLTHCPLPASIEPYLYPHQRDGVEFLRRVHLRGTGGCLLADEMGLGKTVQVAVFLGDVVRRNVGTKMLLIVPTSMLDIWKSALTGQWGGFSSDAVVLFTGTPAVRRKAWQSFTNAGPKPLVTIATHATPARAAALGGRTLTGCTQHILLTTAGVLHSDIDLLETFRFDYAVMDEAQVIRNTTTNAYKAAVRLNAVHRVAITGTPVMNSLMDLWALSQFVDRNLIDVPRSAFAAASAAVSRGIERDASDVQHQESIAIVNGIRQRVGEVTLRRTKADVDRALAAAAAAAPATAADRGAFAPARALPHTSTPQRPAADYASGATPKPPRIVQASKTEVVVWVKLTTEQRRLYDGFIASDEVRQATSATASQSCCFVLLSALKKICDHPYLNLTRDNLTMVMRTPFEIPKGSLAAFGTCLSSGKVACAVRLIRAHIAEGLKTVVFSESKVLLQILATVIGHQLPSARVVMFTGDVPIPERAGVMRRFNTDPQLNVCLATTGVGGVGVTLTGASRAILMDPSWNPAVDSQAVDRVHRIGQTRDVVVYRLITCGTVEEKTYRRQIAKLLVAKQMMGDAGDSLNPDHEDNPRDPDAHSATQPNGGESSNTGKTRYFTRAQMRELFVFDHEELDASATAQLIRKMHGRTLPAGFWESVGHQVAANANDNGDARADVAEGEPEGRRTLRAPDVALDSTVADLSDHLALFSAVIDPNALQEFLAAEDEKLLQRRIRRRVQIVENLSQGDASAKRRTRQKADRANHVPPQEGDSSLLLPNIDDLGSAYLGRPAAPLELETQTTGLSPIKNLSEEASEYEGPPEMPRVARSVRPSVADVRAAMAAAATSDDDEDDDAPAHDATAPPSGRPSVGAGRASLFVGRRSCAVALFQSNVDAEEYDAEAIAAAQREFGADAIDETELFAEGIKDSDGRHGDWWDHDINEAQVAPTTLTAPHSLPSSQLPSLRATMDPSRFVEVSLDSVRGSLALDAGFDTDCEEGIDAHGDRSPQDPVARLSTLSTALDAATSSPRRSRPLGVRSGSRSNASPVKANNRRLSTADAVDSSCETH
jgi:hypothetical protein